MNNSNERKKQDDFQSLSARSSKEREAPFALDGPNAAELKKMLNEVHQAGLHAGIRHGDPMYPMLECMSRTILFLANLSERSERVIVEAGQRVENTIAHARTTADAELKRFEAGSAAAGARTIANVSQAIARGAEAALTKRVSILHWRSMCYIAFLLVAAVFGSLWGGYDWGSRNTRFQLEKESYNLNAFSRLNPADAHRWAGLMLFNDSIKPQFDKCLSSGGSFKLEGRKACNFTLWVE